MSFIYHSRQQYHKYKENTEQMKGNLHLKNSEKVILLILTMSKLKLSLCSNDCIKLINDLIKGTQIQKDLINWKKARKVTDKYETLQG